MLTFQPDNETGENHCNIMHIINTYIYYELEKVETTRGRVEVKRMPTHGSITY